jgi:flavin-dependent dehydrogenase
MLKKLLPADLYARLREAHADPCHPDPTIAERLTILDAQTTEVIKEINSPGMLRIDRNRMRKLCKTGLRIQYNKKLDSLTYGPTGTSVTAHFLDGTTATGDLVIGADGARSVVREQLLGPQKAKLSPSPVVMMITTVNFHDAEKARHARTGNPIMKMAFHPTQKTMLVGSKTLSPSSPGILLEDSSNLLYSSKRARRE